MELGSAAVVVVSAMETGGQREVSCRVSLCEFCKSLVFSVQTGPTVGQYQVYSGF